MARRTSDGAGDAGVVAFGHGRVRHVTRRPPYSATGHEQPTGAGASPRAARTARGNADAASRHARGAGGNASMARAGGIARMAGAGGTCACSTGAGVTGACNSASGATRAGCSSGCRGPTRAGAFQFLDTRRAASAAGGASACPARRLHAACRRSIRIRHGLAGSRPFAFLGSADSHGLDATGARTRARATGSAAAGPGGAAAPTAAPAPAATRSTCQTRCADAARSARLLAGDSSETD